MVINHSNSKQTCLSSTYIEATCLNTRLGSTVCVWAELSPICQSPSSSSCSGSQVNPGTRRRQQSSGPKTPSGSHRSRWEAPRGSEWCSAERQRRGVSCRHQLDHKQQDTVRVMMRWRTLFSLRRLWSKSRAVCLGLCRGESAEGFKVCEGIASGCLWGGLVCRPQKRINDYSLKVFLVSRIKYAGSTTEKRPCRSIISASEQPWVSEPEAQTCFQAM